jgi:hypothetical protein
MYASLVREGEQFEGRAMRSARRVMNAMKTSRGYETVEKAARTYQRRLRKAYAGTTAAVLPQAKSAAAKPAAAKAARKRS